MLLGKFYYRKLIETSVFFGYLYQTITLGHSQNEPFSVDDGPEELARSRLVLTLLSSLSELRFETKFHVLIREFLGMLRCYLSSKFVLSKEIYELSLDVFKVHTHHMILLMI